MPFDEPVYLARTIDGSDVTITLVGGDWVADGAARDRFTAEANAARRAAPVCAARILGAGLERGDTFLGSDYVSGPSLREFLTPAAPRGRADIEAGGLSLATR